MGAIVITGLAALVLALACYAAGLLEDDGDFGRDPDEGGAA